MTDNEKLIEEAKYLIEQAESFRAQVPGEAGPNTLVGLWLRTAAVLAVFEKAHTPTAPTEDEREALATALHQGQPSCVGLDGYGLSKEDAIVLAAVALDAGFRRSEVPEPSAEPTFPPEILAAAARFTKPDALNRLVILMMTTWGEKDPESSVAQHPASYVATFADMAKAILADLSEPQGEPSAAQTERARIVADLREWARPLGNSPEEDTLLVIERIERTTVTEQGENR